MKTYVEVFFSSEGEKASVVTQTMLDMGLKPSIGEHDFAFKWNDKASMEEVLGFIDEIQKKLKGTGVRLSFTTIR